MASSIFLNVPDQPTQCPPEIPSAPAFSPILPTDIDLTPVNSFCKREPAHPICSGWAGSIPTLDLVKSADTELRRKFVYRSDRALYGVDDYWTSTNLCGDCEDYVLMLSAQLAKLGVGGQYMTLMTWFPNPRVGHATLIVQTSDASSVEIGVSEAPATLNWNAGRRYAWMVMDGKRHWTFKLAPTVGLEPTNLSVPD